MKKLRTILVAVFTAPTLGGCVTDGAYPGSSGDHSHHQSMRRVKAPPRG